MQSRILLLIMHFMLLWLMLPTSAGAIPGDADGNGVVEMNDAQTIARFVTQQIPALPNPADADATQDGQVDMEDAFIIAKHLTGQSQIVVVAPRYGRADLLRSGDMIRIEVFEKFFPFNITGGTIRIRLTSTGYDTGDQLLTFEREGRSLYYHWDTGGLLPASDYEITVTLNQATGLTALSSPSSVRSLQVTAAPVATVSLTNRVFEPPFLAAVVDAFAPAPGISLEFRRVVPHDSANYPYLGPLGMGWVHNYDISLEEFTNGSVAFHGSEGFNRFFRAHANGTYTSSPGDYGSLTRDPNGTFQLQEKDGLIYRFRSDLRLDFIEDLNRNRISAIYSGSNRLVEIRHSSGQSFFLDYNNDGHISRLTDHVGRETLYEYTSPFPILSGLKISKMLLDKVTDPVGAVTHYVYNFGQSDITNFRLLAIAFPDGTYTHYEYDNNARLVRQTGTWGANPVTYSYDVNGTTHIFDALGGEATVRVNNEGQPIVLIDLSGSSTDLSYDASANLVQATDSLRHVTQMTYDGFGNVTQTTNPLRETVQFKYDLRFHKPSLMTDPLGNTTALAYNSRGNLLSMMLPDSSQESYTYDIQGNPISIIDAAGKLTRHSYNAQGQMTSLENALGSITQFSYDISGDLTSVINSRGQTISYVRDLLGRVTQRTYPDGSHEDFAYDASEKVMAFVNRRGERISFLYDNTGRLEWKLYPSGRKWHFRHDSTGYYVHTEEVFGGTTSFVEEYERDAAHRVTKVKVPGKTPPESYDVSYAYDAEGNRRVLVYPDGYILNYTYDDADRLLRISDVSDNTIVAYKYNAAGRLTLRQLGNGTYTTYQYDALGQLTLLVNYAPNNTVQSQFAYTYNVAQIQTSMATLGGVHSYAYDDTYQVTSVAYPNGQVVIYDYDEAGNRISVTDSGVTMIYTTNKLDQYTQAGSETFAYDANGNPTTVTSSAGVTTYGWDHDDNLVSVDRGGIHIDYRYDHQGLLIAKTVAGQETRYIWDGLDLIAEMNSVGQIVRRYIYGAEIDELVLVMSGGTNFWAQQDGQNSVVGLTDDSGVVIGTVSYDIYGNIRNGALGPVPQHFVGMWWDKDAGLYYVRARWYDPMLGRFLQTDPLGIFAGLNLYTYARNDPVNLDDPQGLLGRKGRGISTYHKHTAKRAGLGGEFRRREAQLRKLARDLKVDFEKAVGKLTRGDLSNNNFKNLKNKIINLSKGIIGNNEGFLRIGGLNSKLVSGASRLAGRAFVYLGALEIGRSLGDLIVSLPWGPGGQKLGDYWVDKIYESLSESNNNGGSGLGGSGPGGFGGGTCPTYVQLPSSMVATVSQTLYFEVSKEVLAGQILIPGDNAMLRANIPIYGIAGGKAFKEYHVEYGEGKNPLEWYQIVVSSTSQNTLDMDIAEALFSHADAHLYGNLADWNTGLKNWFHLPCNPPENSTDLNGIYTLRLTVTGKDGQKVEDRVTVEVGRVVAQAFPGIATSPDKRIVMRFPEQALTHPFRIYTILPLSDVGEEAPPLCRDCKFIGPVYRIREPGDRFAKNVSLEFNVSVEQLDKHQLKNVGIGRYDIRRSEWIWLDTAYDEQSAVFSTQLHEISGPKAIYTLLYHPAEKLSHPASPPSTPPVPMQPIRPGVLVENTFEGGFGTFKARDRFVGAELARDTKATPDGSYSLKLTNTNHGGNFSSTVLDQPFDVSEYGTMTFDYRIRPGVKIDFFLKVEGRWYALRFTGDPVDYRHRGANMANLGAIQDVVADDQWHTASVDLHALLRQQTRYTRVDEVVMANWRVSAYKKLEFGNNSRGATYYLDNFRLTGPGSAVVHPSVLLVDNFNELKTTNMLGEAVGAYSTPGMHYADTALADTADADGRVLQLAFDTTQPGAYGGYWTSIASVDLTAYETLAFQLQCNGDLPPVSVGIRNQQGIEGRTLIGPYAKLATCNDGWQAVRIPLSGLRGLPEASAPDVLFFAVSHHERSGKGALWIDDVRFEHAPFAIVTTFEESLDRTLIGGETATFQHGAAALSAGVMPDLVSKDKPSNSVLRLSYGGTIGRDYGPGVGFSYAAWRAGLNGLDARPFTHLTLRIRGERGGETPNVYLSDGVTRFPIRAKELPALTQNWQTIHLPLAHYATYGIDLSHLDALEVVFEWDEQSGTIYIDDIVFTHESTTMTHHSDAKIHSLYGDR